MQKENNGRKGKIVNKNNKRRRIQTKQSLIDDKNDWNGSMFPFKGTKDLYKESVSVKDEQISDLEDEEYTYTKPTAEVKLGNALGAIMGAYMSDEEEENCIKPVKNEKIEVKHCNDSDEMPDEVKNVKKEPVEVQIKQEPQDITVKEEPKEVQEIVQKVSKGRKRKKTQRREKPVVKTEKSRDNFPYKFKKRKVTLLEKLLENEIRNERNILLQCVKYVVTNDFLQ